MEQSLRWSEPRRICQLYGQMIIWTSLLNKSLLYDSEDRSAWCKFGEGRRLCICQRLSWCSEAHRAAAAAGLCSTHCPPVGSQDQSSRDKKHLCRQISLLRANFWRKAPPSLSPARGEDLFLTALLNTRLKAFLCSGRKQTPA